MTERQWRKVCSIEAIASLDNLLLAASKTQHPVQVSQQFPLVGLFRPELLAEVVHGHF